MSLKDLIKYIIFRITPHLIFDRIAYIFTSKDSTIIEELGKGKKNVYLFGGCDYANLGDYAITIAQQELLKHFFPDKNIIVFTIDQTYKGVKAVLHHHDTEDIVTIIGGGNMGDLYYGYERKRNFIISKLKDYRIISFPQTISFRKNRLGELALKRSIKTYTSHKNLLLLAREEKSYKEMQRVFPKNKVILVPDVVMTLCKTKNNGRNGCVLSIRNDKESILTTNDKQYIKSMMNNLNFSVIEKDTCPSKSNSLDKEFKNLLSTYASSQLVVTDRLHGMIFAYITGTPAIVLPNNNGKIENSYKWIKDCGYIYLISQIKDIEGTMQLIDWQRKYIPNNSEFIRYYEIINS